MKGFEVTPLNMCYYTKVYLPNFELYPLRDTGLRVGRVLVNPTALAFELRLTKIVRFRPYSSLLHPHKPVRWSLTRFIIMLHLPRILMTGPNYTILMIMRLI